MGFFDLFKSNANSNKEVWRDASGKISCPGDSCPKECDDTCPIFLNTQAMQYMMTGSDYNAIPLYEKAVRLAPDFYDAWNNMAAIHGNNRNFEKAYECYKNAHNCSPGNPQPLFGLALVTRDLKRYDECITWCDEYRKIAKDDKAEKIRNDARNALNNNAPAEKVYIEIKKSEDILKELIQKDIDKGHLHEGPEIVPELAENAGSVTHGIYSNIKDFYLSEVNEGRMSESRLPYYIYHTTMLWSALAGIGAMELWDTDRDTLLEKGISEALTEERGYFAMDEFILDMVTDGFGSEESDDLQGRLELHIQPMLFELLADLTAEGVDADDRNRQFAENCMALYQYGIAVQADRLRIDEVELEDEIEEEDTEVNMDAEASAADTSVEERCGRAWLQIAGQKQMDKGLAAMRELGDEGFNEGYLALAMFTENPNGRKALLKKAADAGNAEAMWQYACTLQHSFAADTGDAKDKEWLSYCTKAAESGCADAMSELGNVFHRQKNYAESMYWYATANYHGHDDAGRMSMPGIAKEWKAAGMPRDHIKGTTLFDDARFECAMTFLELYAEVAVSHNVDDIFRLALDGTPIAGYLAGDIYESQGLLEMAYKSFNAIAFENDPHGIKCCADMLMTGRGTQQRPDDAFRLYEKAANAGDLESMFVMGEYCRNKGENNKAAYWYGKAYARGYEPAETRLLQMA